MVKDKKYFHEISIEDMQTLIDEGTNVGAIIENYKQPSWCTMPGALNGVFGCWSLMDLFVRREEISHEFCSNCDSYKECK